MLERSRALLPADTTPPGAPPAPTDTDTALLEAAAPPADTAPHHTPPPARPCNRAPWHTWWNAAAVGLPAAVILFAGYQRRWMSDDGLIYTRTVRQILGGYGPVFNPGERAEASTGTLWQWLLALLAWATRIDPGPLAVGTGLVLTAAGYLLALDGTRRLYDRRRPARTTPVLLPAGVLVLLALPPVWDFATSGLETGLGTCWMGSAWWCLTAYRTAPGSRRAWWAAAVLGAGPLVRPDFAIPAAVLLAALLWLARPGWRRGSLLLADAAAAPAGYELFRAGYYGELFPLPAVSKGAGSGRLTRGLAYLGDFVSPYHLWVPLLTVALAAAVLLARRPRRVAEPAAAALVLAPAVAGLLMLGYVVWVGGDFMHARMLLPGLFMMLLPVALVPAGRAVAAPIAGLATWALVCAVAYRVPYSMMSMSTLISDEHAYYVAQAGQPHPDSGAQHAAHDPVTGPVVQLAASGRRVLLLPGGTIVPLRPDLAEHFAFAWPALGVNGVDVPLDQLSVDPMGLSYPLAAHLETTGVGRAGHDKWIGDVWIVADYGDPAAPAPKGVDPGALASARHALSCGALAELLDSARAPLTASRFWDNLTGAAGRSSLRLPADPAAAEREFCDGR